MEKAMALNKVINIIRRHVELQIRGEETAVPFLIGPPGGGKTSVLRTIFTPPEFALMEIHFAFIPIEELSGIPKFKEVRINGKPVTGTEWSLPEIIAEAHELAETHNALVLFLDDFHLCSPTHIAYGYQLFTDRRIRNYTLPPKTAIILAGNWGSAAGAKTISSAIANRCAFYFVHTDYEWWKQSFGYSNVDIRIISFLNQAQNRKYFHEEERVNEPWASPRAWTRLSNIILELEAQGGELDFETISYVASAHVGAEAGSAFATYYSIFSKFDVSKYFDGEKFQADDKTNLYIVGVAATAELLTRLTSGKSSKKTTDPLKIYVDILNEIFKIEPELSIALLRELINMTKSIKLDIYSKLRDVIKTNHPEFDSGIRGMFKLMVD